MRVQHKRLIRVILALVHICISPPYQQKFTKPKQLDGTNTDECDTIRINKNLYGYNIRQTKTVIEDGNMSQTIQDKHSWFMYIKFQFSYIKKLNCIESNALAYKNLFSIQAIEVCRVNVGRHFLSNRHIRIYIN